MEYQLPFAVGALWDIAVLLGCYTAGKIHSVKKMKLAVWAKSSSRSAGMVAL
jgi:hypothetical protein